MIFRENLARALREMQDAGVWVVGAAGILVNGGGPYTGANALSRLIVHAGRPIGSNNPFIGAQILAGKVEFVTSIVLGVDGAVAVDVSRTAGGAPCS